MKKFLVLLLLTGCVSSGRLATQSGDPEVLYNGSLSSARGLAAQWIAGHGFTIGEQNDYKLTGVDAYPDTALSPSRSALWNGRWYKVEFTFAPVDENVRIIGNYHYFGMRDGTQEIKEWMQGELNKLYTATTLLPK